MTTEPATRPPNAPSSHDGTPPAAKEKKEELEYDDFGLPVRKARPKTPLPEDSVSEDEKFEDAVASKSASREQVALPDRTNSSLEKAPEDAQPLKAQVGGEETAVNGHADNDRAPHPPVLEKEEGHDDAKPTPVAGSEALEGTKADLESAKHAAPSKEPVETELEDSGGRKRGDTVNTRDSIISSGTHGQQFAVSEYSHQQLAPQKQKETLENDDGGWQTMPAYARYDMYNDDDKLIAKENAEELEDMSGYGNVGGAAKGYTRVTMDDDAESQTSMDDNTAYLFTEKGNTLLDDDEAARDPLAQMQATKSLLTEGQRIAYVGLVRLAMAEMTEQLSTLDKNKNTKKLLELTQETMKMWTQKMMVRLYSHMDIDSSEQVMIEQLSEHGVMPPDLTPALMQNARVKNPVVDEEGASKSAVSSPNPDQEKSNSSSSVNLDAIPDSPPPPPYIEHEDGEMPEVRTPSQLPQTKHLDIDLRWTILCDLFLVLIADSVYDSRSRQLLEQVAKYLSVDWLDICRFEKRVTDALEMQEEANRENWNEDEHMESRRKKARNRRLAMMGLATVGGGLVIGLSAGLMAPFIGAGLVAGFSTIGIGGTAPFLAGIGGTALITTTGVVSGSTVGVRAANRRTGSVQTFEYRPLHNNKRVNLIVTVAGWMNGKVDDVRLPYSTVDPVMGDLYSVLWEPEMLRSMGETINILATEALTQGLQQVLGSTILIGLMAALQLPVALTKLSYLIDNPWSVSQARADMAGLILADSIIDRNLGTRPITLVGFSLGARVIFACLRELANRGAFGLVQNVYMFGTPVVAKRDEYTKARAIVPGRFINGYATNDWILGYLFRATSGGIMRVAGLAAVDVPGIENINVTEQVPGHMAYRAAMPKLLREVGWMVESDEFAEIEDPDPENHEARQRELINEIEEARKEMEKKPEKKGFSFWRKKKAAKKDWEVYDENSQKPKEEKEGEGAAQDTNPVIFDIDAIRAEVAALSHEDIEIKEIKSTLPPMKIDMAQASPPPYGSLRQTRSHNDSLGVASPNFAGSSSNLSTHSNMSNGAHSNHGDKPKNNGFEEYDEYDDHNDGGMTMTFDSSFKEPPSMSGSKSTAAPPPHEVAQEASWATPAERPPLKAHATESNVNLAPGYNAWADDDDEFGKEKEMKMTFE
ncbi:DUF726-domain-containing protein [Polyplosphaeria fusca]|uniref:DUF726-domain-containing protein n=1 Tax=Polyplosphaeria fusca TaxID=682080 RepID=A0A9P4R725_9PLEO|nr:DUF726-domain-containing protein [Polyplosphaeria fusca]